MHEVVDRPCCAEEIPQGEPRFDHGGWAVPTPKPEASTLPKLNIPPDFLLGLDRKRVLKGEKEQQNGSEEGKNTTRDEAGELAS